MHQNAEQMMDLEDPVNRTPKVVERTVPVDLALYGLVLLWFDRDGHRSLSFPNHPWYRFRIIRGIRGRRNRPPRTSRGRCGERVGALDSGAWIGRWRVRKLRLRSLSSSSAAPPDRHPTPKHMARVRTKGALKKPHRMRVMCSSTAC